MKYIEELEAGELFLVDKNKYILSADFKSNGSRMGVALNNGQIRWFKPDTICHIQDLYYRDEENNILLVKESSPPASVEEAIRKVQPKVNPLR